jgi:hypothetical protein
VATNHTSNRNIPYPDGKEFVPKGPEEMQAVAVALDTENRGEIDFLQAGVVASSDWNFTAAMENSATCALESTGTTGGVAWLPLTAIGLVRSVTSAAKLKALVPPSLPSSGKYLSIGFELTPSTSGAPATASLHSGAEKASQAEAEAAPPAATAGKIKIRDVVVKNTGGVYSIVAQRDRRPWAKGAFSIVKRTAGNIAITTTATADINTGELAVRIESLGIFPIRFKLQCSMELVSGVGAAIWFGFSDNGAAVDGTQDGRLAEFSTPSTGENVPVDLDYTFVPSAGSHLFRPRYSSEFGESAKANLKATAEHPLLFTVEEVTRPNTNNGTS